MVPLGVSIATTVRVGGAFGAGELSRLRLICVGGIGFTVAQTSLVALAFLLWGEAFARTFVDEPAVIEGAASILVVVGLFQIFDGVQVSSLGALRGLSDVTLPMGVTFVAYWVIALPLGYYLGIVREIGGTGVWIGLASGLCFAAFLLTGRLWLKTRL